MELAFFSHTRGLVAVALLLAAQTASAQQPPQTSGREETAHSTTSKKQEAMQRFKRAIDLYEEGDYAASLIEFRKANNLAPSYKLRYKIGQVAYKLKDYAGALRAFEAYLLEGGDAVPEKRREEVEEEIRILKAQVGYIRIQCNEPGAVVTIDDKPVGQTPLPEPIMVSIGKRKILITKDGRAPVTRVVDVAGKEQENVSVHLAKLVGTTRTVIRTRREKSKVTGWTWAGVAGAGALAAGAAITGIMATNASEDLKGMTYAGDTPTSALTDQQSKTKNLALTSDILTGASIVTLTTTLIWTFARPTTETTVPARDTRRSAGANLYVTPVVGIGQIGVKGGF